MNATTSEFMQHHSNALTNHHRPTLSEPPFSDFAALAASLSDAPAALITLAGSRRSWYKSKVSLDVPEADDQIAFCGFAIEQHRQMMIIEDTHLDRRFSDHALVQSGPRFRFYAGFPLTQVNGSLIGTLCLLDYLPRTLTPFQISALKALARQIVELWDSRERISDLIESERHFRAYFDGSLIGMATTGAEKQWIRINDTLSKMLGYTQEEMARMTWEQLTHPDDLSKDVAQFNRLVNGEDADYQLDKRYIRKDGHVIHTRVAVRCVRDDHGKPEYFVAMIQDLTQKRQSEEVIWQQANFDSLTRLPNRLLFRSRLEEDIKKANRYGYSFGLLFIDLDRFKEVNDSLGHAQGDQVLIAAARRISACVRETDMLARVGGDEFVLIVGTLTDSTVVEVIAGKILNSLSEPIQVQGETVYLSASIGVTMHPNDASNADDLIRNAEQAMYVSKQRGRNRFSYFTQALQDAAQYRLRLANDLRSALKNEEFKVYFQPIVDLKSGRIVKAEALVRWVHPEKGMISPADFIPIAEETGLIVNIGQFVFQQAAQWAKKWEKLNAGPIQVSINMSPVQFRADTSHVERLMEYMIEEKLQHANIVIEITEGLLMHAEPHIMRKISGFRDTGIQVAIDDFGTGYSSLSYLKKFDIDFLKIDQSFVRNLQTDVNDQALCEAMIVMAHKLGLKVIAEGVETVEQSDILLSAGCDYAQGYLFSRPVPPETLFLEAAA